MLSSYSCVEETGPFGFYLPAVLVLALQDSHTAQMFLSFVVGSGARLLHFLFSLPGVLKLKWGGMHANS